MADKWNESRSSEKTQQQQNRRREAAKIKKIESSIKISSVVLPFYVRRNHNLNTGDFFLVSFFCFVWLIRSAHFVSTREIRSVIAMAIRFIRWMPLTKIEMILVFVFFAFFSYLKKSKIKVFFSINNNYRIFVLKCFQYSISQMTLESDESKCTLTEAWDEFNSFGLTRNIFINAGNEKYFE